MRIIACCRTAVLLLLCTVSFSALIAQEKKISGIVKDEAGAPLPGATISIKNSLYKCCFGCPRGLFPLRFLRAQKRW